MTAAGAKAVLRTPAPPWFSKRSPQDQFLSRQRRPRVKAWYDNLAARPGFKTAVSWPDESGGGYEEVGLCAKAELPSGAPPVVRACGRPLRALAIAVRSSVPPSWPNKTYDCDLRDLLHRRLVCGGAQ